MTPFTATFRNKVGNTRIFCFSCTGAMNIFVTARTVVNNYGRRQRLLQWLQENGVNLQIIYVNLTSPDAIKRAFAQVEVNIDKV